MRRTALFSPLLLAFALFALGCTPTGKAKGTLEKYEPVFRSCKEETDRAKAEKGAHPCSLVASQAVDMGLEAAGVDEAIWRPVLLKWLDDKGFRAYYVPPEKREKEPGAK